MAMPSCRPCRAGCAAVRGPQAIRRWRHWRNRGSGRMGKGIGLRPYLPDLALKSTSTSSAMRRPTFRPRNSAPSAASASGRGLTDLLRWQRAPPASRIPPSIRGAGDGDGLRRKPVAAPAAARHRPVAANQPQDQALVPCGCPGVQGGGWGTGHGDAFLADNKSTKLIY